MGSVLMRSTVMYVVLSKRSHVFAFIANTGVICHMLWSRKVTIGLH